MSAQQENIVAPLRRMFGQDKLNCVDVGARGGMQKHWRAFAGLMDLTLFEPDAAACKAQADKAPANESWFPIALGGTTGTGKLYVTRQPSGSSLYRPNHDLLFRFSPPSYGSVDKIVDVTLSTFSDFIEKHRRPLPNLIKLDVQGAELDILKGLSPEHSRDLLAVQAEVEFAELYVGQPLFGDIDAYMKQRGFMFFDLLPVRYYRYEGEKSHAYMRRHLNLIKNRRDVSCRLVAGDAFYIRDPESVLASGNAGSVLKLFVILTLYRFLDEALWLAEAASKAGVISAQDSRDLIAVVRSVAPRPGLLQRADRIGKLARKLSKLTGFGRRRKIDYWLDRSWDF
jgi:FkbM family methyltransferase